MNITEATHVNTLLQYVFGQSTGTDPDRPRAAAAYLADRARAALNAGHDARSVHAHWPDNLVAKAQDPTQPGAEETKG